MKSEREEDTEILKAIEERRTALIFLSPDTLLSVIHGSQEGKSFRIVIPLPDPYFCLGAHHSFLHGCFMISVASPKLESVPEGCELPVLDPAIIDIIEPIDEEEMAATIGSLLRDSEDDE